VKLSPTVKLAGNELASFSAFLDERWRTNDWTWGRSDSVPTLVHLLLGDADKPALPEWDRFVGERQEQIFKAARRDHAMPTREKWDVGVQTLTEPGSSGLHGLAGDLGAVAGQVVADALPPPLPRLHGPLSSVLSGVARRLATPRGWPNGSSEEGAWRPPDALQPRRGKPSPVFFLGLVGFGALVAAIVRAIAANLWSLLIGALAGLLAGSAALWLSTSRSAARSWIWNRFLPGVVVGLLVAGVVVGIGDLDGQLTAAWDWIRNRMPF
jgi:hypothetical protein